MCLINRSAVKALALERSITRRNAKFSRVSASFLDEIEAFVRRAVERAVDAHPSVGKTLMSSAKKEKAS